MKLSLLSFVALSAVPVDAAIRRPRRTQVGVTTTSITLPTGTAGPEAQSGLPTGTAGVEAQSGVKSSSAAKSPKSPKTGKKGDYFMNKGYEYLTDLIADKECLTTEVLLSPDVCFAVGGYPLAAFYGDMESTEVACCPKPDVDLKDVAEYCVETPAAPGDCTMLAPEGVAILLATNVTWCCHEPVMMMEEEDGRRQ